MTMSSKVTIDLNAAVRDWLSAHRPAVVPATVLYRAEQDTGMIERPYFVVACEGDRTRSVVLHDGELVLRMRVRDDDTAAADAAAWLQASVAAIGENFAALKSMLEGKGYFLRLLRARDYADAADGTDGRSYEQRWGYQVQTGMP